MLKFKADTLELIAKGEALSVIADFICRWVEARCPGVACTMLSVDQGGMLHPLAAPSLPDSYFHTLDNVAVGPDVGACGSAAYSGHPVVTSDIANDPRWQGYKSGPLTLGLKACWSSPIVDPLGRVAATFALYFRECRGPTRKEIGLVALCGHLCDLAFARHSRVEDRERRATTDALTGLPNRGSFETMLLRMGSAAMGSWGIFLIDLDNLKITNDTFGHAAGDRLLQEMGSRLAEWALPDRVFRIGGDEFALLAKAPERLADPQRCATALMMHLTAPVEFPSFSIHPAATIGCAMMTGNGEDPAMVHRQADVALYHAKETRRGGFVRFSKSLETRMAARISSIEILKDALLEDRISAWYEPVVTIAGDRLAGFEARHRIVGRDGARIEPPAFGDAGADAQVASAVTERLLTQVADDMKRWHDLGIPLAPVSINLTAIDLMGGRFRALVDRLFAGYPQLLAKLIFEVTESVYLGRHATQIAGTVHALRRLGIRIAVDDFGTGYISLPQLLTMPVDIIKIDRSFIARLPEDALSATIIAAIVAVAGGLGASVAVEGVETEAQMTSLAMLGCATGQGPLFAAAMPSAEAAHMALRHGGTNASIRVARTRLPRPAPDAAAPPRRNAGSQVA